MTIIITEAVWREPGQVVTEAYRRTGALRYTAEEREIVGRNRSCFNNRPLYSEAGTEGVVLTGDRPFVRLLAQPYVWGGFCAGIVRAGVGKWFHEYSFVETRYRCGRMRWCLTDASLPAVAMTIDVVPMQRVAGFAVKLQGRGLRTGDVLVWAFGGASASTGSGGFGYWVFNSR